MTGRVTTIEGGCVVFKNDRDARQWVLVGETRDIVADTAYVIDGVAMDSMDPRCPQALPFHVTKATEGDFIEDLTPLPSATKVTGSVLTLTGLVTPGVEPGCRVIQTDQGSFVLVGPVAVPDGRVEVTGMHRDDLLSTCQQGTSFEVHTVKALR